MEPMLVDEIVISMGKACDVWKKDKRIVVRRRRGRLVASQWDCWLLAMLASALSGLLSCFLRSGEMAGEMAGDMDGEMHGELDGEMVFVRWMVRWILILIWMRLVFLFSDATPWFVSGRHSQLHGQHAAHGWQVVLDIFLNFIS